MRSHAMSRGRLFVVCFLGALAGVVPTASADTTLPVWTCRASAAYVEVEPLVGDQRVEPVLANGFPNRANPDTEFCSTQNTGIQDTQIPEGAGDAALIRLEAASARTQIDPEIAPAREQTASADAGIAETVRLNVAGLVIDATVITATASGSCVEGEPTLTGSSQIASLSILGLPPVNILNPGEPFEVDLLGIAKVALNQQTVVPNGSGETLTQQAAVITVPSADGSIAKVVLGEVKVDYHGAVCAPPPVCPPGYVPQENVPNTPPGALVCLREIVLPCPEGSTADPTKGGACVANCPTGTTREESGACIREVVAPCPGGTTGDATGACIKEVIAPCPANATSDPNRGGACIIVEQAPPANCPAPTTRDPATNNCILVRDRPCPAGATPDPATRVCVVSNTPVIGSGENGRVGSPDGPVATCGRLSMRFVRGTRNFGRSFTSRFGNRTVTRGLLVTCGSNPRPIIGARVDVVHVLPGNKRRRKTGLRSRAQGRLTLILPIDLRTRNIEYAYRPDLRSTRVTSRVTLRLTVRNRAGRILR